MLDAHLVAEDVHPLVDDLDPARAAPPPRPPLVLDGAAGLLHRRRGRGRHRERGQLRLRPHEAAERPGGGDCGAGEEERRGGGRGREEQPGDRRGHAEEGHRGFTSISKIISSFVCLFWSFGNRFPGWIDEYGNV